MFKSLIDDNEKRSQLSMMAQYLNTCFMISTIENEYLVNIEKGVVKNVSVGTIFYGVTPFWIVDIIRLAIIVMFPAIALFLPSMMF